MSTATLPPDWPPKNARLPDLSGLYPNISLLHLMGRLLGGAPRDRMTGALILNFVRLVDKAVRSYEAARKDLDAFRHGDLNLTALMSATSHIETCVGSCCRANRLAIGLDKVTEHAAIPAATPAPPYLRDDPVRDLRNAIEHMDERIEKGQLTEDQLPLCVVLTNVGIMLSDSRISYADLADRIRALHAVAERVAHYQEEGPESVDPPENDRP